MTFPFMRTASGLDLPLAEPRHDHIRLRDVAHHLAMINRFCGATPTPYSVAQHSVLVARLASTLTPDPATLLWALLHDAHEAYVGDLATPVQATLFGEEGRNIIPTPWDDLTARLDAAIAARFGISLTAKRLRDVKLADHMAYVTEWRDLMPGPCPEAHCAPHSQRVRPLPWHRAEESFLTTFTRLAAACGLPTEEFL